LVDKRRLLELEEQKRRAEEDKLQAITELEVRGLEDGRVNDLVLRKMARVNEFVLRKGTGITNLILRKMTGLTTSFYRRRRG
jgi:hypothetical protein